MAKRSSGMPEGFKLQASRADLEAPVELNDYLDQVVTPRPRPEPERVVPLRLPAAPAPDPAPTRSLPREEPRTEVQPAATPRVGLPAARPAEVELQPVGPSRLQRGAARKQINLSPNALATLEEVLLRLREYSGQKDLASSELVAAMIMAVHEAMPNIDLVHLPRRGPWGSPSATNFPAHLKRSFVAAIGQLYAANYQTRR